MQRFPILPLLALLLAPAVWGQNVIRLKSRTIDPRRSRPVRTAYTGRHLLLQFRSYPEQDVRDNLAQRGIRVLDYVPDNTLMVAVPPNADLAGLDLLWMGPLEPRDKVSSAISASLANTGLIIFHRDADMKAARVTVAHAGLDVVEQPGLLPNHLLVAGAWERIEQLAEQEDVAYILPADNDLRIRKTVYVCPGPLTAAGPVADYSLVGTGWPKDAGGGVTVGYFLDSVTNKLPESTVRSELERAFAEWSRYANVDFTPAALQNASRSVDILFASHAHGDSYPFDGPGGVLAHTFFPAPSNPESIAGDMHFDNDENWSVDANIDLYSVALHEAGHALGLGHSDQPSAVMYPYYRQQTGLTSDDIAAVQALYGVRGASSPAAPAPPPAPPTPPPPTPPATPTPPPAPPPAPPAGGDTVAPRITILSPASTILSTSASSIAVVGTATDNVGVTSVTWAASTGSAGTASGTTNWSATVPLLVGDNTITLRAYDAAGNVAWRALMVVRN